MRLLWGCAVFFFFNDTATTEIYTLSLHDALPIRPGHCTDVRFRRAADTWMAAARSEEHTSELQSRLHLVCRLLLEKKKPTRCTVRSARPALSRTIKRVTSGFG